MRLSGLIVAAIVVYTAFPLFSMTSQDKEEYEKLGLSQVEWEMFLSSKMSKSKLYGLLKCGISLPEYFKSPWLDINMSEDEWVGHRCAGQSSSDIKLKVRARSTDLHKTDHDEWLPIQSFFLPGVNQLARNQQGKGWTMLGIAVASIGVLVGYSLSSHYFEPLGFVFLVPDMLWSGVDMGIQVQHEQNPEAARFTYGPASGRITLTATIPLRL